MPDRNIKEDTNIYLIVNQSKLIRANYCTGAANRCTRTRTNFRILTSDRLRIRTKSRFYFTGIGRWGKSKGMLVPYCVSLFCSRAGGQRQIPRGMRLTESKEEV